MRSISEIKAEKASLESKIKELDIELMEIKHLCPHPKPFLTTKVKDYYDECGAPVYESSLVTICCSLCEGVYYKDFDRKKEKQPTLDDILKVSL